MELITPDEDRKVFVEEYKKFKQANKVTNNKELDKSNTEISQNYPSFKDILEAYPSFFKQGDSLKAFLDARPIEKLHEIDKMEGYRRALDSVSLEGIPLAGTQDESYSLIPDKHYTYEPSAKDKFEKFVGLKQRKERSLVHKYLTDFALLYEDGKLDENDINQLDKLNRNISHSYAAGKITNDQYTNLRNEVSAAYQKIFKKRIDSLSDNSMREQDINMIKEDITDTYSDGKLIKLHYKLLIEKVANMAQ